MGSLVFLGCLSHGAPTQQSGSTPLYVDSKAINERFSTITAEDMEMLRSKKILLASRSFGLNLRKGLEALAKQDKKYEIVYSPDKFDVFKAGGDTSIIPSDVFSKMNFVHFLATAYPEGKRVDETEQVLRRDPIGKTVDVVYVLYSVAKPTSFDYYAAKMDALQAEFPKVRFIYGTAGCKGPSKTAQNEESFAFSEKVRQRYMGKVPLYDLGKILSDDFRNGHQFCPGYSTDPSEEHPNTELGEIMMAKGFLLVLRDAFRAKPGVASPIAPVTTNKAVASKSETIPANHPDAMAVRAILDANGLTKKTVEGVSVVENGRIVKLYLQEGGITELPDAIGKLDALRLLHLYGDRKQPYPLLKKVSPEIGRCVNLEELLLNQNDLEALPTSIAKLQKLKFLSIGDNHLRNLPPEVVKWASRFDPKGVTIQK